MSDVLEIVRHVRLVLWLAVLVWMAASMWRDLSGNRHPDDPIWSLFGFVAMFVLGYSGRWIVGIAPPVDPGADLGTMLGLNIFGCGIAVAIMWKRYVRKGWNW